MKEFDHAVVGAGIVGSWTALHLLKSGKNVLLLEQFREPHTRGSSHGQSRLIRSAYEEECFARMMPFAFDMWKELEQETGKELIVNTGILCLEGSSGRQNYENCVKLMKEICPENLEEMSSAEVQSKFSKTLNYKNLAGALLDKSGGIVLAHKALLAVQALFRQQGGTLWDNCQVHQIIPEGDKVKIKTAKGDVIVRSVAVCAGSWTQKLLTPHLISSLPLQPVAVNVFYWKEKVKGIYSAESGFPGLLELSDPPIYALPTMEYPGLMKGGAPCDDPDERDKIPALSTPVNTLKDYIKDHIPLLETEPAIVEKCMYTITPDEIFIIDTLPGHKNIVLGAGFSGTGFKTSPTVGRLLSEMAVGTKPFLDVTPFRLSRFECSAGQ